MTLRNGRGDYFNYGGVSSQYAGGGIRIIGDELGGSFPVVSVSAIDCDIDSCYGSYGGGVWVHGWSEIALVNCRILNSTKVDPLGLVTSMGGGEGVYSQHNSRVSMTGGMVSNSDGPGIYVTAGYAPRCEFEDVEVSHNGNCGGIFSNNTHRFLRCRFLHNTSSGNGGGVILANSPGAPTSLSTSFVFEGCEFVGNSAALCGGAMYGNGFADIRLFGCTITGNTAATNGAIHNYGICATHVSNSIIWGNGPSAVFTTNSGVGGQFVDHSNFEGGHPGTGNIDVDPMFVPTTDGGVRLDPISPCIDAGVASSSAFPLSAVDLDGDPRISFAEVDMGADECAFVGRSVEMAGAVLDGQGNPVDLLAVNGSFGDAARRVQLGLAQTLSFSMAAPPGAVGSKPFAVFGAIGIPDLAAKTALPFGIGTMAFAPCPLVPFWNDVFFTLTNNVTPLPCGQLLASYPAPWISPTLPPLGVVADFTLQGVVERADGTLGVTNGLVVMIG
ncbi:MAG: right-handed parallel beta-helix repeat-containing protein [Planctomycetota bacterium]